MTVFLLWEHMKGRPESERILTFIYKHEKAALDQAQAWENTWYEYEVEEWEVQDREG